MSSWDVESSASSSLASLRLYLLHPGNCEAREQRRAWPRTLQCQDLSGVRYILPQAAVQHSVQPRASLTPSFFSPFCYSITWRVCASLVLGVS